MTVRNITSKNVYKTAGRLVNFPVPEYLNFYHQSCVKIQRPPFIPISNRRIKILAH